jgi:two-component system, OmpR family, sensor histidine kinase QseC
MRRLSSWSNLSIRRRLVLLLLACLALVWSAMLAAGYHDLREEVSELADARMEQSARTLTLLDLKRLHVLAGQDNGPRARHDDEKHKEHGHDDDERTRYVDFQVWSEDGLLLLRAPGAPDAAFDARDGHITLAIDKENWRSYALRDPRRGYQVRVFERTETRSHLVNKLALRMAQLLLLALPVLGLLIWLSVGRGLMPLTAMSRAIGARSADNLQPLGLDRVPAEVQPLADSLNNLLERLSDSIDRERSFTADAAHELRTPLAAIQVQAEVALAAEDDEQRRHAIRQVIAGVHRTTHLSQQLLLLARLDHVDASTLQTADLGQVAIDSAARHAEGAECKSIEMEVAAEQGCTLRSDPMALSIMVDNLIDNAVKYGRINGHVEIRVVREHAHLILSVKDDGPGVSSENHARLTDRFYRIPGSDAEGSGLGLAIVERIASHYHGHLAIGNGLHGTGLGVTIIFPV